MFPWDHLAKWLSDELGGSEHDTLAWTVIRSAFGFGRPTGNQAPVEPEPSPQLCASLLWHGALETVAAASPGFWYNGQVLPAADRGSN